MLGRGGYCDPSNEDKGHEQAGRDLPGVPLVGGPRAAGDATNVPDAWASAARHWSVLDWCHRRAVVRRLDDCRAHVRHAAWDWVQGLTLRMRGRRALLAPGRSMRWLGLRQKGAKGEDQPDWHDYEQPRATICRWLDPRRQREADAGR